MPPCRATRHKRILGLEFSFQDARISRLGSKFATPLLRIVNKSVARFENGEFSISTVTFTLRVYLYNISHSSTTISSMSFTPPRALFGDDELRDPQTPAPQRARVNNLNQQVDRLVREKQNIQVRLHLRHAASVSRVGLRRAWWETVLINVA